MANRNHQNSPNLIIRINGMDDVLEAAAQTHFATRVHAFVKQEGIQALSNTSALVRIVQECFPGKPMVLSLSMSYGALVLTLNAVKNVREPNVRKFSAENLLSAPVNEYLSPSDLFQLFNSHIHPEVDLSQPSEDPTGQLQVKQVRDDRRHAEARRTKELSDELLNTKHQLKHATEQLSKQEDQIEKLNEIIRTEREKRYARADLKILNPFALRTQKIKQLINTIQNELTNGSWSTTYFQHYSGMEASILRIAEQFEKAGYKVTVSDHKANTNRTMKIELPTEAASAPLAGLVEAAV